MPHSLFDIVQNDTSPAFEAILRDGFGSPVDVSGATVVFHMRLHPAGAVKVSGGAMGTVGSAVNGRVKYSWSASDTDTAGEYEAEVQVTFNDGTIQTFPPDGYVTVLIKDDIA